MLTVIQRYKAVIIILGFLALMIFLSWFVFKDDSNKIPSRGVFVVNSSIHHTGA